MNQTCNENLRKNEHKLSYSRHGDFIILYNDDDDILRYWDNSNLMFYTDI
jgi:hypothetical protein